jgi:hypothetical protein
VSVLNQIGVVSNISPFSRAMIYGSPVFDQIGARGGNPDTIVAAVDAALRQECGSNPTRLPLQIIVFEATRP